VFVKVDSVENVPLVAQRLREAVGDVAEAIADRARALRHLPEDPRRPGVDAGLGESAGAVLLLSRPSGQPDRLAGGGRAP